LAPMRYCLLSLSTRIISFAILPYP